MHKAHRSRMLESGRKVKLYSNDRQIRKGMEECLESISSIRRLVLGLKLEAFTDRQPIVDRCSTLLQMVNDRTERLDDPQSSAEVTEIARRLDDVIAHKCGRRQFNSEIDWSGIVDDFDRLERICSDALKAIDSET